MVELLRVVVIVALLIGTIVVLVRMVRAYSIGDMITGLMMVGLISLLGGLEIFVGEVGKRPVDRRTIFLTAIAFVSAMGGAASIRNRRKE